MTTATVDITGINRISEEDKTVIKQSTAKSDAVSLDTEVKEAKSVNNNYFYSSGSFKFILDKGFKPETLELTSLTAVPFLPEWHLGIVSIHGLIMPVIDILAFGRTQKVNIQENDTKKSYLLKLEHNNYSPIVFKLDALPQLINIDDYIKSRAEKNAPDWIKHYIKNNSTIFAFIDHQKLFDQMINTQ